jgi:ketosteroid isomerase-like protein
MSASAAGPNTEEVASASRLLLGRDRELARLYGLVDRIEEQGGALVVRGEAGIGKSALLDVFTEDVTFEVMQSDPPRPRLRRAGAPVAWPWK